MHASRILSGLYVVGTLMVAAVNAHPDYDGIKLPVVRRATTTSDAAEYKPTRPADGDAIIGIEDAPSKDEGEEEKEGEKEGEKKEEEKEEEKDTKKTTATGKSSKTTSGDDDEPTKTSKKSSSTTSKPRIGIHDPAGGISMIEPKATEPLIYKFGETITFKWNMTSVKASPTAINVEAYNTANKHYYTIAQNISAKETEAAWDTEKELDAEFPLMEERYTLVIYDSKEARTAVPKAGYLGTYQGLTFGLYKPKPAIKNEDFQCVGCSGASGVRVLMGSTLVAVFSAMFFVFARVY